MNQFWRRLGVALIAGGMAVAGCGENDSGSSFTNANGIGNAAVPQTQRLVVTEPALITVGGDSVDSLELEAFDASGQLVAGPTIVPFSTSMEFPGVPASAQTVELDYLRNQGFTLFRVVLPRQADGTFDTSDPDEKGVAGADTGHSIVNGASGVSLETSHSGVENGVSRPGNTRSKAVTRGRLRGVCYSPSEIGVSNKQAPAIGDLFWDTIPDKVFNWYMLWGKGDIGGAQARNDLDKIRDLNCNCLRTYCMLPRQIYIEDPQASPTPFVAGTYPDPPTKFQKYTHKQFLDLCWNNGNRPLYVLVGIPLPSDVLYRYGNPQAGQLAFYDNSVSELVTELKDHPAVLGFTLFNEEDENRSAWPGMNPVDQSGGVQNADSDYYYGVLKRYSKLIHDITGREPENRKLVGWAAHEDPNFQTYGGKIPAANPYFTQLTDIDFYGVNTYQSSITDPIVGDRSGSFARLPLASQKPVILTELGWVGVKHNDDGQLEESVEAEKAAAAVINLMIPKFFSSNLILGSFYFEFSDEWWKQPPNNPTDWTPGPRDPGQPNQFHDQEAFGLYSTALGAGRKLPTDPPTDKFGNPIKPPDPYFPRKEMVKALTAQYKAIADQDSK